MRGRSYAMPMVDFMNDRPRVTQFERTKIQAAVLVPLIKAMEDEIGTEEAHRIVRESLGASLRDAVKASTSLGDGREAVETLLHISKSVDAQDHQVLPSNDDELNVDVTRCEYAQFFQRLGEPELGYLLVCERDYDMTDALNNVDMTRTTTIMLGSDRCDFRFKVGPSN